MHLDQVALHLHIAAGRALEFHHTLYRGVGRDIGEFHFNGAFFDVRLHHAERETVVGLWFGLGFRLRLALHGEAKVKLLRRTGDEFPQGQAGLVGLAHFQSTIGRDETHALGAVPLDVSLQGGLETEQALRGHLRGVLGKVYADGRLLRDNTAGKGFDVRGEILGRRLLHRLFRPAGRQQ